jgi:predicted DNA-binding protein (UPF0251 family)
MSGKTEWEDALIKHGIMDAPKEVETEDDRHLAASERAQEMRDRALENKSLAELEDEVSDEEFEALRRRRLADLQHEAALARFGVVRTIGKGEFVSEVSESSKVSGVVCHLFAGGAEDCALMDRVLSLLAARHKKTKFVRIPGEEAIKGYPAAACPTLLLYNKGELVTQLAGLRPYGGRAKFSADTLEWVLSLHNLVETQLAKSPLESLIRVQYTRGQDEQEDDDDEW